MANIRNESGRRDGKFDIAVAASSGVGVMTSDGDGGVTWQGRYEFNSLVTLATADVNAASDALGCSGGSGRTSASRRAIASAISRV